MAVTSNSQVNLSDIRNEFKASSGPVSMSQLNRGGGFVPLGGARNTSIPSTDSNLSFSKYRNTAKSVVITYQLIGGGGGGGFGVDNKGEDNRGTYGGSGGSTTLVSTAGTITGAGGTGGENCGGGRGSGGRSGASSPYGSGGAGGSLNSNGGDASGGRYGAGGGGGGGDSGSTYDSGGCSGFGGNAGTRKTGTMTVAYDSVISLNIGSKGIGPTSGYDGGDGAGGYAKITWDGYSKASTSGSNSHTIN